MRRVEARQVLPPLLLFAYGREGVRRNVFFSIAIGVTSPRLAAAWVTRSLRVSALWLCRRVIVDGA